jgi:hypothetical protein
MNKGITLDVINWSRWREVERFAQQRNITVEEAIQRLVNSGLSHWSDR